jgi:hypothetical protein
VPKSGIDSPPLEDSEDPPEYPEISLESSKDNALSTTKEPSPSSTKEPSSSSTIESSSTKKSTLKRTKRPKVSKATKPFKEYNEEDATFEIYDDQVIKKKD